MSEKKRKAWYRTLKIFSIIISCLFPIYAVIEHFPLWTATNGIAKSIGAGSIISLIVIVIIFRKAVFDFIKKKLKLDTAPPLSIWIVLIIITYILIYIAKFLQDLVTVFWMGLLGCAIGTLITFIAEHKFGKKE